MWTDTFMGVAQTLAACALTVVSVLTIRAFQAIDTTAKLRMFQLLCMTEVISFACIALWCFFSIIVSASVASVFYASSLLLLLLHFAYVSGAFLSFFGSRKTSRKLVTVGQCIILGDVALTLLLSIISLAAVYFDVWVLVAMILLYFSLIFSAAMGTLLAHQLQMFSFKRRPQYRTEDFIVEASIPSGGIPAAYYVTPQPQQRGAEGYGTLASGEEETMPLTLSQPVGGAGAGEHTGDMGFPASSGGDHETIPTFPSSFRSEFREDLAPAPEQPPEMLR
ncbi:hypothetical protein PAPYR_4327 [Paratrimastix pyriformis]|uniref:Uncharacterized protein n=1 Tax=Paratrimastix pyriformis TaxID=342808 RepID=A0ABQ8UK46_9EUKA|nr:hypothetical protein PAPYR_4327 [Paratrimastix pyriformis]